MSASIEHTVITAAQELVSKAQSGNVSEVKALLRKNDFTSKELADALWGAARCSHPNAFKTFKLMVEAGADLDQKAKNNESLLKHCIDELEVDRALLLLDNGVTPIPVERVQSTYVHWEHLLAEPIRLGQMDIAHQVLEYVGDRKSFLNASLEESAELDVNENGELSFVNTSHYRLAHVACVSPTPVTTLLDLIDMGVDPAVIVDGKSALVSAILSEDVIERDQEYVDDLFEILAKHGCDPNPDPGGPLLSPLRYAAAFGTSGMVSKLLELGADPTRPDRNGKSLINHLESDCEMKMGRLFDEKSRDILFAWADQQSLLGLAPKASHKPTDTQPGI